MTKDELVKYIAEALYMYDTCNMDIEQDPYLSKEYHRFLYCEQNIQQKLASELSKLDNPECGNRYNKRHYELCLEYAELIAREYK
jgi:hypothetical protein